MSKQLAFMQLQHRAGEAHHAALDALRDDVSQWWSTLSVHQRDRIAAWVNSSAEFDAFAQLAAEAGSWVHEREQELVKCLS
jgi:hypothetical protein